MLKPLLEMLVQPQPDPFGSEYPLLGETVPGPRPGGTICAGSSACTTIGRAPYLTIRRAVVRIHSGTFIAPVAPIG